MRHFRISFMLLAILVFGCVWYAGCGGGGIPGGGLSFFTSSGSSPASSSSPQPSGSATTTPTPLATGRIGTYDLILNSGFVYWTERTGGVDGGVFRIKTDGSSTSVETVATGITNAFGLTIVGSTCYVTDDQAGVIYSIDLTKTFPATPQQYLVGLTQPLWIRTDGANLFWTEYGTNKRVGMALAGQTSPSVIPVTDSTSLDKPFALYVDAKNGRCYITEAHGSGSAVWWVRTDGLTSTHNAYTPTKIFSGSQTWFGSSIHYDNSNDVVYWTEYNNNPGLFRIARVPSSGATPDTVESNANAQWPDCSDPTSGQIYFSWNVKGSSGGNIYADSTTDLTKSSSAILPSGSTDFPFRMEFSGGAVYWTEFPGYDPATAPITTGGNGRVMKFQIP